MKIKNNIPNLITLMRMGLSLCLIFLEPFSPSFWTVYTVCGLSDMLDGHVARKLKQETNLGSVLDSLADLVFLAACLFVVVINVNLPKHLLICTAVIALIKVFVCTAEYYRLHRLNFRHNFANKLTGVLLFASPIIYSVLGEFATGIIVASFALFAALFELYSSMMERE